MTLHPRVLQKSGHSLLLVAIFIEVILTLIYLAGIFLTGKAYPAFNMDREMTIPSFFQAFQLFLIGFVSLSLFLAKKHSSKRPSKLFMLTVAILFFYGSLDELVKIHLRLGDWLDTSMDRIWMPIFLGIGLATIVMFRRDLIALWHFHRRSASFIALGMGLYVLGGFGAEVLKYVLIKTSFYSVYEQGDYIPFIVDRFRVAFEEFSEMLGPSLTLYGICLYVAKRMETQSFIKSH